LVVGHLRNELKAAGMSLTKAQNGQLLLGVRQRRQWANYGDKEGKSGCVPIQAGRIVSKASISRSRR